MFSLSTFFPCFRRSPLASSKKREPEKGSYHHGDLKRALMDEALRWISREGVERLNLRELARLVGVSHGAPYRHFPSREDLIIELALEGATLFLDHLEKGKMSADPSDIPAQFRAMGEAYFRFATNCPHHYRLIFMREVPPDLCGPKVTELNNTMGASFFALVEIVQQMQHAGHIRPDDPFLLSAFIWSQLHGFASLILDGRFQGIPGRPDAEPINPQVLFHAMVPYLLSGVGTKGK